MLYLTICALTLASAASTDPDEARFEWALPEAPAPVEGECERAVDLVAGKPLPEGLVDDEGRVRCYATVVPTSDLAGLLLVDAWADRAVPRGLRLQLELAWEVERYERLSAAFDKPTPWLQRPGVQRNLGRAETFAVFALALVAYGVLDNTVVQ